MRTLRRWFAIAFVLSMASSHASAASPREELLGLLPSEPTLCVAVQDLRGQSHRLLNSPFGQRFQQSPLFVALLDAEPIAKLREMDEQLKMHLQTSIAEIRDEVLGDAVVLAFWPGDGMRGETALIMAQARNKELPAQLLKRLNDVRLQSGELQRVDVVQYGAISYTRTAEANGKIDYQLVTDGMVALTSSEDVLKQVIDRKAQAEKRSNNGMAKSFADLGVHKDAIVFWINPRSFDTQMADKLNNANGPEVALLRAIQSVWQQTSGVALSGQISDAVHVRLSMRSTVDSLSPTLQKILKEARTRSAFWNYVPDDAIAAVAGRFDVAEIARLIDESGTAEQRGKLFTDVNRTTLALLGMEVQKDVLDKISPDWGCYVAPCSSGKVAPDLVLAARLHANNPDAEEAFADSLRTLGGLLAMNRTNEGKPTMLKRSKDGNVRITSLWNEQWAEAGLQPAGTVKDGYLVLASSPDAIARFQPRAKAVASKEGRIPLARISFTRAGEYLNDPQRRASLVSFLGQMHQQPANDIEQRLQHVTGVFDLFDAMELWHETGNGGITLSLRLTTKEPLTPQTKSD